MLGQRVGCTEEVDSCCSHGVELGIWIVPGRTPPDLALVEASDHKADRPARGHMDICRSEEAPNIVQGNC